MGSGDGQSTGDATTESDTGGERDGGVTGTTMATGESDDPIRVLHVDDEPALLAVTEQYLQREDDRLVVETATSPSTGLDLLAAEQFDVVVSDYQMPGMDGLGFLETVRTDSAIPFIIFTGRGRERWPSRR